MPVHTKDDNYNDNDTEAQHCWNHFQNFFYDKNTDSQSESTQLQRPWAFKEKKQLLNYNKMNYILFLHWCGH